MLSRDNEDQDKEEERSKAIEVQQRESTLSRVKVKLCSPIQIAGARWCVRFDVAENHCI